MQHERFVWALDRARRWPILRAVQLWPDHSVIGEPRGDWRRVQMRASATTCSAQAVSVLHLVYQDFHPPMRLTLVNGTHSHWLLSGCRCHHLRDAYM